MKNELPATFNRQFKLHLMTGKSSMNPFLFNYKQKKSYTVEAYFPCSNVLAAYAEFLWYTEEDDDGEGGAEGDGSQNSTM